MTEIVIGTEMSFSSKSIIFVRELQYDFRGVKYRQGLLHGYALPDIIDYKQTTSDLH